MTEDGYKAKALATYVDVMEEANRMAGPRQPVLVALLSTLGAQLELIEELKRPRRVRPSRARQEVVGAALSAPTPPF